MKGGSRRLDFAVARRCQHARRASMGAEPYSYVVPYDADPQRALDRLRSEVFASGRYFGASKRPATPERALELAGESGTRSILDIETVADEPDFRRAAP